MTAPSRRRLLCRAVPGQLAQLLLPPDDREAERTRKATAFAAFDSEWLAMGPELLMQAVRAAGLAEGCERQDASRDELVKALWEHQRRVSDVG